MPALGGLFGGAVTMFATMYHRRINHMRQLARPWDYVFTIAFGGYLGYNFTNCNEWLVKKINELLIAQGFTPRIRKQLDEIPLEWESEEGQHKWTATYGKKH